MDEVWVDIRSLKRNEMAIGKRVKKVGSKAGSLIFIFFWVSFVSLQLCRRVLYIYGREMKKRGRLWIGFELYGPEDIMMLSFYVV